MAALTTQPLITTIIPTYRRPVLLRRAILSALHQTYPHVQVCVYDNASGDETGAVVAEIAQRDPRVKYHCHPQNIGSYNNFNYGIREVETPFFSLLSDDDVLTPTFYEEAMWAFEWHPEAMFACMAVIGVDADLRVTTGPIPLNEIKFYKPGEAVKGMLEGSIPATWTGIVFRREIRNGIGLIDTTAGINADGGYVYHAAARFAGIAVPGIAAALMTHEGNTGAVSGPISGEWMKGWETMMRTIYEDDKVSPQIRKHVKKWSPPYLRGGITQMLGALSKGDYKYASRVAKGIRECGYPVIGKSLVILSRACAIFPALNVPIRIFHAMWRKRYAHRWVDLHKKYGHLVEFVWQYVRKGDAPFSKTD